jgi:hypothetical protein
MTTPTHGGATARTIGIPGIALVVAGAVLLALSFVTLAWYDVGHGIASIKFSSLHALSSHGHGARVPRWYFGWLAGLLLGVVIVLGIAANLPGPLAPVLRIVGPVIGLFGVVVTYWALHKVVTPASVFDHTGAGLWFAFAGFLLAGTGAALGPRTRQGATITP